MVLTLLLQAPITAGSEFQQFQTNSTLYVYILNLWTNNQIVQAILCLAQKFFKHPVQFNKYDVLYYIETFNLYFVFSLPQGLSSSSQVNCHHGVTWLSRTDKACRCLELRTSLDNADDWASYRWRETARSLEKQVNAKKMAFAWRTWKLIRI